MKTINLTQNKVALVDDKDFDKANLIKWHFDGRYAANKGRKGKIYLHRFIIGNSNKYIDHINHDKLDNRRENLRICNQSYNLANQNVQTRLKSSLFKGVSWHKLGHKWMASIKKNQKRIYLGLFEDEKEAAENYNLKATELFGEFALLNKI